MRMVLAHQSHFMSVCFIMLFSSDNTVELAVYVLQLNYVHNDDEDYYFYS